MDAATLLESLEQLPQLSLPGGGDGEHQGPVVAVAAGALGHCLGIEARRMVGNDGKHLLAQYRAGRWQAATQAAEKATLLGDAGAAPQLVRAMAQWRLGQKAEAERAYQAVLDQVKPEAAAARDIDRLRREAARLLGQAPPASQGGTLP